MLTHKWKKVKKGGNFKRQKKKLNELCAEKLEKLKVAVEKNEVVNDILSQEEMSIGIPIIDIPTENIVDYEQFREICDDEVFKGNWLNELSENESEFEITTEQTEDDVTRQELRIWAIENKINHMALKQLFPILNKRIPNLLPIDPRTFLRTPYSVTLNKIGSDGLYWHQGIEFCLRRNFDWIQRTMSISININFDGLRPHKSSTNEFWPILFNITEYPNLKPMIIGIYCGQGKPSDLKAYLTPFVDEMKMIMENGIYINGYLLNVTIRCIICDSPARSFIKGTVNFNAQNGCGKCCVEGEYSYVSHANYFKQGNYPKKTDYEFRNGSYGTYHKEETPLTQLTLDLVVRFPIGDELHLLHLGLMKRLITGWKNGTFYYYDTKWRQKNVDEINEFLINCRMPEEINRAVRTINVIKYWKGVEYRTFLHYISIVVLKKHLSVNAYDHFLLLFLSAVIFSSTMYTNFIPLGRLLIEHFVELYSEIYGSHHVTSNVHNLLHVCDDVETFGILSTFSTYPFESALYKIKNLLRSGNLPLAQVANRIAEMTWINGWNGADEQTKYPILSKKEKTTDYLSSTIGMVQTYSKIRFKNFSLSTDRSNKWFLTHSKEIVGLKIVVKQEEEILLYGARLMGMQDFFTLPIHSSMVDIFKANINTFDTPRMFHEKDIRCKMVCVQHDDDVVFIPLLHTIENEN